MDSLIATATVTNRTWLPYLLWAAVSAGSSSLQFGHQAAQNSINAGPGPVSRDRSTVLPSSVRTAADGACAPTSIPPS